MPTTLFNLATDPSTRITMKWTEPYVTDGLNLKMSAVVPHGVHRGWRLGLTGAEPDMYISILPDPTTSDSVLVQRGLSGHALTIYSQHLPGLTFPLTGAGLPGQTVVVVVAANYAIGVATTADLRVYLESEWIALPVATRATMVALGKVVVPVMGAIPAANITPEYRSMAWEHVGSDATPWTQLVKNGGFESAPLGAVTAEGVNKLVDFWRFSNSASWDPWEIVADSASGEKALAFNSNPATLTSSYAYQPMYVPCKEGQRLKVRCQYKVVTPATGGTASIRIMFNDASSGSLPTHTMSIPLTVSTGGVYQTLENVIESPTGCCLITRVECYFWNVILAGGAVIQVDDVQLLLEQDPYNSNQAASLQGPVVANAVTLKDAVIAEFNDLAAQVEFDKSDPVSEGQVTIGRQDGASNMAPRLNLLGRLLAGSSLLDTDAHALLPRLAAAYREAASAGLGYTLLWESIASSGTHSGVRLYAGANSGGPGEAHSGLYATLNCYWDGTNWNKDLVGTASKLFSVGATSFNFKQRLNTQDTPWTDLGWSSTPLQIADTTVYAQNATINAGKRLVVGADGYSDPSAKVEVNLATGVGVLTTTLRDLDDSQDSDFTITHNPTSVMLTFNAAADAAGSIWNYTNPSDNRATQLELKGGTVAVRSYSGADGWANTAWVSAVTVDAAGNLQVTGNVDATNIAALRTIRAGDGFVGVNRDERVPRYGALYAKDGTYAAPKYTLLAEHVGSDLLGLLTADQSTLRIYAAWDGGFVITINAEWIVLDRWYNALGGSDHTSMALRLSGAGTAGGFVGAKLQFKNPGAGIDWADTSWVTLHELGVTAETWTTDEYIPRALHKLNDGSISFVNVTDTASDRSNPPRAAAMFNKLCAKNTTKSWGRILSDSGSISYVDGFNLGVVLPLGTPQRGITVSFPVSGAMSDDKYVVITSMRVLTPLGGSLRWASPTNTGFDIIVVDDTGNPVDISSAIVEFSFQVMGSQA